MHSTLNEEVATIRKFNRFYTNVLGLLNQDILKSEFSLSEARVLHEIQKSENCTSKSLAELLSMDPGYLSRILKKLQEDGLVDKKPSSEDGRSHYLYCTEKGEEKIAELNARSDEQLYQLVKSLSEEDRIKIVQNVVSLEHILTDRQNLKLEDITIRNHVRPGDASYITYMHARIYSKEYNYNTPVFEGYVAQSFHDFLMNYDPNKYKLWIAEHNNEIVGSIAILDYGDRAQLRWFLLHPDYRGIGLGKHLLNDAIGFCKQKGFKTVYLETTNDLDQAISMYTKAGFVKVAEKENDSWKDNLTELKFELNLEDSE
ncbi:transcriptional regulator, MarR family with acetyltransferase activity [Paenibacillus sp. 1_12]|uniref:bifunctional helix-turn-helix transcriptional regulator/GNAT family N-acetyltransferase n=1 Tax=Paenibacillus sp. 1_12 TaxID=1566278 RepID=UPI0008E37EBF|nr:bifunctional helix-turn-helix transcriptional regulator/GNAT family N-acetyltransferase [Paenibacillus sp. 1_12]SFM35680.1 transcriptional regulator, MarR family with acetyltransferase activity [Paenibacillus sp. 1_12]